MSPGGIGAESDSESILTLGANSSMAFSFTSVCYNEREYHKSSTREGGHTSQLSRMKQRDLARDLRGPKAAVESVTPRSSSVVADTVDLQFRSFLSAAGLGSGVSSGRTTSRPCSMSALSERMIRGGHENDHVYIPSGFPPCGIEEVDGEGETPSSSPSCPLPTATLTSECRREPLWLVSPPSMSASPPS